MFSAKFNGYGNYDREIFSDAFVEDFPGGGILTVMNVRPYGRKSDVHNGEHTILDIFNNRSGPHIIKIPYLAMQKLAIIATTTGKILDLTYQGVLRIEGGVLARAERPQRFHEVEDTEYYDHFFVK